MIVAVGIGAWGPVNAADAESSVTPQAAGLNASWMEYLPPPAQNPVICVIDGGVDLTPDTESIVTQRLTVMDDGELGDAADGDGHGTLIASLTAAPRNGLGTVGLWPYARIVSVRATDDIGSFTWSNYGFAMSLCQRVPGLVVVNLSLGGPDGPGQPYYDLFLGRVSTLLAGGVSVVSSTGNEGGAVNYPAAINGVVAIAANDGNGGLCVFASRQPGVISAPGCPAMASNRAGGETPAFGTSFASPLASTLIASIRAYRPDLSRQQVEEIVAQSTRAQVDGSRAIDAEAAYRLAGLAQIVDQAKAVRTLATGTRARATPPPVPAPPLRWVKVRRSDVIIRLRRPYVPARLILLGRHAKLVNTTTIRARRTRNTWKLSLVAVDGSGVMRRSKPRDILIRKASPDSRPRRYS